MAPKSPLSKNSSSRSSNPSCFSSSFCIPQISPYLTMGFWASWLACVCLHYSITVSAVVGGHGGTNRKYLPFHCFHSHKKAPSVLLCWGICRGSVGTFELAKEGRLRRLLSSWKVPCEEQSILLGQLESAYKICTSIKALNLLTYLTPMSLKSCTLYNTRLQEKYLAAWKRSFEKVKIFLP